jgi:A118 family predicted phage portal protein
VFTRLLQWIREVFKKMISLTSVKEKLRLDVAISSEMANALQTWSLMYENRAPWLTTDIKSLNLPAAIAGEIARAATIEMEVEITGSPRADYLATQLAPVLDKLREKVEMGTAKGGLVFKPFVDGDRITVNYVQADQFYPVSFDSDGNMTACIFADQRQVGNDYYTRLEYHRMTELGCEIANRAFKSSARDTLGNEISLAAIDDWKDLLPEATITGVVKPLFAYFKYPLANNVDPSSPLGVSCYSRAVSLIEQADRQWSRLLWEFESGERALYVDTLAFGKDSNNKPILPNKRLYRTLDAGGTVGDENLFQDWSPTFREQNLLNGLDAILKRIEYTCGLAYGTLSDPNSIEKTATEIAASKQRSQATVVDTQKALENALNQLLYAMDTWATLNTLAPKGAYEAAYDFDDSLIVDSEAQFLQDQRTVGMGAMPKWMFLVRNYGLTEEVAKQWIADQQAEQPKDFFGAEGNV